MKRGEALISVLGKPSKVLSDQIMAADKTSLKAYIDELSLNEIYDVENALKIHLGLPR